MAKQKRSKTDPSIASTRQKVLLVDAFGARASVLKKALLDNEYVLVEVVRDVRQLVRAAKQHLPDFLVLGIDEPDQDTIAQLVLLKEHFPLPVILFAEKDTPQAVEEVVRAGVSAFVVNDIQAQRFPSIISIALARFRTQQGLLTELETTRSKLAERKVVDKAKGLLMAQKGLSEDEAYRSLRKLAMDRGQSIGAAAESLIDVLRIFDTKRCT